MRISQPQMPRRNSGGSLWEGMRNRAFGEAGGGDYGEQQRGSSFGKSDAKNVSVVVLTRERIPNSLDPQSGHAGYSRVHSSDVHTSSVVRRHSLVALVR